MAKKATKKEVAGDRAAALRAKLAELAPGRVSKTIRAIRNVGKLGRYRPTSNQTGAVFAEIKKAVEIAYNRWTGEAAVEEKEFVLPEG